MPPSALADQYERQDRWRGWDEALSRVPIVLTAWRLRLARMGGLQAFLGPRFPAFERGFLEALASPQHRTSTRVVLVVATTA